VKLQLVGDHFPGYEDYVDGLTRLVTELGLSDAVSFDGFAAEPKAFMTNATVMLVPSRAEPFGNVAVEGLGAGIPMVVSQVGGLPEIIKNEETGLCVPPDDPQALAAAVSRHLQNPHEAAQMSRAGFIDARKRFGLNAYRDGIVASVSGKVADLNPL
jgi:hypothetical protein